MRAEVEPGRHSRPYVLRGRDLSGWLGQERSACPGIQGLGAGACAALLPQPPIGLDTEALLFCPSHPIGCAGGGVGSGAIEAEIRVARFRAD